MTDDDGRVVRCQCDQRWPTMASVRIVADIDRRQRTLRVTRGRTEAAAELMYSVSSTDRQTDNELIIPPPR